MKIRSKIEIPFKKKLSVTAGERSSCKLCRVNLVLNFDTPCLPSNQWLTN